MTPLDEIELMKGQPVLVIKKNGGEIRGTLISFDLNANIGIDVKGDRQFISGYSVSVVALE